MSFRRVVMRPPRWSWLPSRPPVPRGRLWPLRLVVAGCEFRPTLLPISGMRGHGCRVRAVVERGHADVRHGDDARVAFDWLQIRADRATADKQQRILRQVLQDTRLNGILRDPLIGGRVAPLGAVGPGRRLRPVLRLASVTTAGTAIRIRAATEVITF
jgi:hypothetical protein